MVSFKFLLTLSLLVMGSVASTVMDSSSSSSSKGGLLRGEKSYLETQALPLIPIMIGIAKGIGWAAGTAGGIASVVEAARRKKNRGRRDVYRYVLPVDMRGN